MRMMLLFLALAYVATVRALTIQSEYREVSVIDGLPSVQATINIECNGGSDFNVPHELTVQSDSGVVRSVIVVCRSPEHHYEVYPVGYIFADGRLLRVEQCLVRDFGRFAGLNKTESHVASTSRSLLAVDLDSDDCEEAATARRAVITGAAIGAAASAWTGSAAGAAIGALVGAAIGGAFRTPKCSTGSSDVAFNSLTGGSISLYLTSDAKTNGNPLGTAGTNPAPWISDAVQDALSCVGTPNLRSSSGRNCFTGPTAQQLTDLQNRGENLTISMNQWGSSMYQYQDQLGFLFGNFSSTNEDLKSYAKAANMSVGILVQDALRDYDTQQMLSDRLAQGVNANQQRLQNASRLIEAMANLTASLLQRTQGDFGRASALLNWNAANASRLLEKVADLQLEDRLSKQSQMKSVKRFLQNLATLQKRWFMDEDMRNGVSMQIQSALDDPLVYTGSTGAFLTPFLKDLGTKPTDPNALDPDKASIETSNDVFKYITPDGRFGIQSRLQTMCGSKFMVSQAPVDPSRIDMMGLIGPLTCDTTLENPYLPTCDCLVRVSELRCPMVSSLTPTVIDSFLQTPLDLNPASGCASGPVPFAANSGGLDGKALTTASGVAGVFQTISLRRILNGTAYSVASVLLNTRKLVPWSAYVSNSSNFGALVEGSLSDGDTNLAFHYAQSLADSYNIVYRDLGYYQSLVYGRIPAGVKKRVRSSKRFRQGVTGRCMEAQVALFSDELLLASAFVPGQVITNIEVTVDGVQSTVSNVRFTSPASDKLPKSPWVWSPSQFGTKLWDIPRSEISLSPCPFTREMKVTYAMCYDKDQCDYDSWMRNNGEVRRFEHDAAVNLPPPYAATVDSNPTSVTYGRCITTPAAPGGTQCSMRDNFLVFASGEFENFESPGTMVFIDREPVYEARIDVPEGAIVEVLSSVCPIVGRSPVSGTSMLIELINPINSTNLIQVREVGGCPRTKDIPMGPSAVEVYTAFSCDTPNLLKIFSLQGNDYVQCASVVDLTFTPDSLSSFRGAAQLNLTYSSFVQRRDGILVAIEQFRTDVLSAILDAQTQNLQAEREVGFVIPNDTLSGYGDLLELVNRITDESNRLSNDAYNSELEVESILQQLNEALERTRVELEQAYAAALASTESLRQKNARNSQIIELVRVMGVKQDIDMGEAIKQTGGFWGALVQIVNGSVQEDPASAWRRSDLEQDDGSGSPSAWSKVGDFFAGILNNEGEGVGSAIVDLFSSPISSLKSLFGGNLRGFGSFLLMFLFIIAVVFTGIAGWRLWSWLRRRKIYQGDADAINEVYRLTEEVRSKLRMLRS